MEVVLSGTVSPKPVAAAKAVALPWMGEYREGHELRVDPCPAQQAQAGFLWADEEPRLHAFIRGNGMDDVFHLIRRRDVQQVAIGRRARKILAKIGGGKIRRDETLLKLDRDVILEMDDLGIRNFLRGGSWNSAAKSEAARSASRRSTAARCTWPRAVMSSAMSWISSNAERGVRRCTKVPTPWIRRNNPSVDISRTRDVPSCVRRRVFPSARIRSGILPPSVQVPAAMPLRRYCLTCS